MDTENVVVLSKVASTESLNPHKIIIVYLKYILDDVSSINRVILQRQQRWWLVKGI